MTSRGSALNKQIFRQEKNLCHLDRERGSHMLSKILAFKPLTIFNGSAGLLVIVHLQCCPEQVYVGQSRATETETVGRSSAKQWMTL
jgi:hypothetical protein